MRDGFGVELFLIGLDLHVGCADGFFLLLVDLLIDLGLLLIDDLLGVDERGKRVDLRRLVGGGKRLLPQLDDRPLHLRRGLGEVGQRLGAVGKRFDRLGDVAGVALGLFLAVGDGRQLGLRRADGL